MGALSKLLGDAQKGLRGSGRSAVVSVAIAVAAVHIIRTRSTWTAPKTRTAAAAGGQGKEGGEKKGKVQVNGRFLKQLYALLKIVFPKLWSPETGYLVLVSAMMLARTYCDLWMIQNGTAIERAIIGRSKERFLTHLLRFANMMLPMAAVNNLLKYGLKELALRFRQRITTAMYEKYMSGFVYYQMSNLDTRISNADQLLTQDVERFCDSLAELYSNLSKPLLDIVLYTYKLNKAIGASGPLSMLGYLMFSGSILTALRKPVGRFTVDEQKLEGEYRYVNSRLITNSEEVSFYGGNEREKITITEAFSYLMKLLRVSTQFRYSMGVVDTVIAKYCATIVGYVVVSRPFLDLLHPRHLTSSHGEIMEDYYRSGRMLVKMAQAVGRIVLAGRDLTRLAGFTARVTELNQVLTDLQAGRYQRTMVKETPTSDSPAADSPPPALPLLPNTGRLVVENNIIRFDHVPLVTPNGEVLVRDMNFEVRSGTNVLIAGPNGCGKSSLFRILGELWPLFGGVLTKPPPGELFYVPQRPYMTLGTLRDQIIYPHTASQCRHSDAQLLEHLRAVRLDYLVDRFSWDAKEDWLDVLSGGEKQRIAMARMFYHKPQFAILDECTSAVSVDVEGFMYERCREIGITLFTVSHRKTLWKYHEYVLQFDGRGNYAFTKMEDVKEQFGS